jgi:hypothetical protein
MNDFELPEVEARVASAPRVHIYDTGCQSCSA